MAKNLAKSAKSARPLARVALAVALSAGSANAMAANLAQTSVEAPDPAGPLKGAMTGPGAEHGPVVLIIPRSGPTDRDGNSPAGIKAAPYRLLAEGLAARGVTTIRIDKRGMFASAAATPNPDAVTIADYAADVHAWTTALRQRTGASCVWLLGHSEGALVAMVAARNQQDVCGLILVSAAGRPMGEVLRDQIKANPANGPLLGQALPAIDALESGRRVDARTMDPALAPLFRPQVQGFLMDVFSYDPARVLAGYSKPVLILQGQRDIQVHEADARILKQANPKATLVLLPDTNHVLKTVTSDDRNANIATYVDPALPLAPGVIDAISGFLANEEHVAR